MVAIPFGILIAVIAILLLILAASVIVGFFYPTTLAIRRGHKFWFFIGLGNIFLPWTVLGWGLLLIWAALGPYSNPTKAV